MLSFPQSLDPSATGDPFARAVVIDRQRDTRLLRHVADDLATIAGEPNRPRAALAGARLLAATVLLADNDDQTLAELDAAVRLGTSTRGSMEGEIAGQAYLARLIEAADLPVGSRQLRSIAADLPSHIRVGSADHALTVWATCKALNETLAASSGRARLRAAMRVARTLGTPRTL